MTFACCGIALHKNAFFLVSDRADKKDQKKKNIFQKPLDKSRGNCYNVNVVTTNAAIAQSVEHVIGNDEVIGPNPISSSKTKQPADRRAVLFWNFCLPQAPFNIFRCK